MPKRPTRPTPTPTPTPEPLTPVPAADSDVPVLFPEIPHAKKRAFLVAYAQCGVRVQAARLIGIDDRMHWYWLKHDQHYALAFQEAERLAGDAAEDKAYQLALNGYLEGIWHKGEQVGTQVRYLPTLLAQILNAAKPDKYKWRSSIEHTISPALAALQRQWEQATLPPMRPSQDAAPESVDAEYEPSPDPDARHLPNAPTVEDVFRSLDELNSVEFIEDTDVDFDADGSSTPSPSVTPPVSPTLPTWQQWQRRTQP